MCFSFASRFIVAIWKIEKFWLGPWYFRARLSSFLSCWQHNPKQWIQSFPVPGTILFASFLFVLTLPPLLPFLFCPFPSSKFFLLFWLKYNFHAITCTDIRCTIHLALLKAITCITHTLFKVHNTTIILDSSPCSLQIYPSCPPSKTNGNQCFGLFQYRLAVLVLEI